MTLDKKLTREWSADNVLLLESEKPFEQFREVVRRFEIKKPKELFTRCLICNAVLRRANAEEVRANTPQKVRENVQTFYCCPKCGKVYWEGSHTKRMRVVIEEVFGGQNQI